MYRGPASRGRSKATPTTVCQKCLKRDNYECTVPAQERPYKPRPSRTQQLLNPSLKPKLTTEVPNELLRKKGVADELLAKKNEKRGRRDSRDDDRPSRNRSGSASSSDSVSTISTDRSLSRSPSPGRHQRNRKTSMHSGDREDVPRKRARSISADSYSSHHSDDRNTRRRMSSFSPPQRGRSRRSGFGRLEISPNRSRSRNGLRPVSRSRSRSRRRVRPRSRSRSRESLVPRRVRGKSASTSPSKGSDRMDTSDEANSRPSGAAMRPHAGNRRSPRPAHYLSMSRSPSRDGGRLPSSPLRHSRSPSPYSSRRRASLRSRSPSPYSSRRKATLRSRSPLRPQNGSHDGRSHQFGPPRWGQGERAHPAPAPPPPPPPPRERSLSPYSKRVALTRAMHSG